MRRVGGFKLDDIQRSEVIRFPLADMNLEIVPEFALLSVHMNLKLGTLDTVRVRDTIDVLDVASS